MKKKDIVLVSSLFILFLGLLLLVIFKKTGIIDTNVYNVVRMLRGSFFDNYFVFITKFGNTIFIVVLIFAFFLILRNRYSILLGCAASCSVITNTIIKRIIQRQRPNGLRLILQGGYSFPSGHAMISINVYGYLLYLVITQIKNKYIRWVLIIFLTILILSIGVSRIYVGVHYATDVIAGYILGIIEVILLVKISDRYYRGTLDV